MTAMLLLFSVISFAQVKITGIVKGADNGLTLPGVSVTVKGATTGTVTDANGRYAITAPQDGILKFTFIGYDTQEISVKGKTVINVTLGADSKSLNEVIVVGYGTVKKKDLTGSVSSIKADDLTLGGVTSNVGQAIQGKAAGVQVQQSDFSPGSTLLITIRGGNSIRSTNTPLYVVDGFISDAGNQISPNDIEDIQILKDASSTAIYGARGANGVILITTKKGKAGKVTVDADASHGVQYVSFKPKLLNGPQYQAIQNAMAAEDGNPPIFPSSFPTTNTDWYKLATQNADVENRNVSLSSGDQNSKLYISANYINQKGVLKGADLTRYSGRIGTEKNLNDRIKIGGNFYGASSISNHQSYSTDILSPLFSIYQAPPNVPAFNADGSYYFYLGKYNAYASLLEPTNITNNKLASANAFFEYEIIKGLTYHADAGGEYNQTRLGTYTPQTLVAGKADKGLASEDMNNTFRWLIQNYLTYKRTIGDHSFSVTLGSSAQKDVYEDLYAASKGFSTDAFLFNRLDAGGLNNGYSSFTTQSQYASFYGRGNYSYKDKILATFTLRDDGSSKFGANKRHGIFPSGALAYNFTDESYIKNLNTFSNLKARVSYGVTGNDRVGDFTYLSLFGPYSTVLTPNGPLQAGIEPTLLANPNFAWETTAQFDAGLDLGFANGRINATIDFYSKKTTNLLVNVPIGQWWGFNTQLLNAGSISNKGIELGINTNNIKSKDFSWNSSFNIAYNKQKLLSFPKGVATLDANTANPSGTVSGKQFTKLVPGRELGEIYGFVYAGVIKTGETYAPEPTAKPGDPKYADLDGDGKITPNDRTYLGNTSPHFTGGFSNDFRYKAFQLNVFFQGSFGYHLYNMNRLVLESTTGVDALNRWVANTNENTSTPREGYFLTTYGSYVNSRFVENAAYLRLKSATLSYSIPTSLLQKTKFIQGLRIYVTGQNLLTFTKYTGTDPEVNGHSGSNIGGGIDFNSFPAFRTFVVGLKLSLN